MKKLLYLALVLSICFSACEDDFPEPMEESITLATGAIPLPRSEYALIPECTVPELLDKAPPPEHLLTFPPSISQQCNNSCTSFAVGYAVMSFHMALASGDYSYTTDRVQSPAFLYNQIVNNDCKRGSYVLENLEILKNQGICSWDAMPYDLGMYTYKLNSCVPSCFSRPSPTAVMEASNNKIIAYQKVERRFGEIKFLKDLLRQNHPIIFVFDVNKGFKDYYYRQPDNKHDVFVESINDGVAEGAHAMVVTGYDDSKGFRIMNSWGNEFADEGFFWMDYNYFKRKAYEAYIVYYPMDLLILNPSVTYLGINDCINTYLSAPGTTWEIEFDYQDGGVDLNNSTIKFDCLNCVWGNSYTTSYTTTPEIVGNKLKVSSTDFCARWGSDLDTFKLAVQITTPSQKESNRLEIKMPRPLGAEKNTSDLSIGPFSKK